MINIDYSVKNISNPDGSPSYYPHYVDVENMLMDHIVRGNNHTLVNLLRSINFDAGHIWGLPGEALIMRSLRIPGTKWLTYLPDPVLTIVSREPFNFAETLPVNVKDEEGLFRSG